MDLSFKEKRGEKELKETNDINNTTTTHNYKRKTNKALVTVKHTTTNAILNTVV